jgi:hypothetical protein
MIRLRNRAPRYPEEKTKDDDPRPTQRTQGRLSVEKGLRPVDYPVLNVLAAFSALVLFVSGAPWVGASCGGAFRYYAIAIDDPYGLVDEDRLRRTLPRDYLSDLAAANSLPASANNK